MQLNRSQVRDPNQRRQVIAENVIHVTLIALAPDGYGLHPIRAMFGRILFEKRRLIDAIGVPLQREWLVFEMGNEDWRNPRVIIDDLAFGKSGGWIEHFIEVGQLELAPINFNDLVGRGHG